MTATRDTDPFKWYLPNVLRWLVFCCQIRCGGICIIWHAMLCDHRILNSTSLNKRFCIFVTCLRCSRLNQHWIPWPWTHSSALVITMLFVLQFYNRVCNVFCGPAVSLHKTLAAYVGVRSDIALQMAYAIDSTCIRIRMSLASNRLITQKISINKELTAQFLSETCSLGISLLCYGELFAMYNEPLNFFAWRKWRQLFLRCAEMKVPIWNDDRNLY